MSDNQVIPEAAVEAAAKALHFFKTGAGWKGADPATVWECREQAESIIRQAAPHMLAEDPRMDAIAAWCGRHRSGYYDEAQDDVMAIIRPTK